MICRLVAVKGRKVQIDRLYRLGVEMTFMGKRDKIIDTPEVMLHTLEEEFPEIEQACRVKTRKFILTYEQKGYKENNVAYVDHNFFDVFTIPLIQGSAKTALNAPDQVVLS